MGPHNQKSTKKRAKTPKPKSAKKLVGYWEERERAEQIHAALKQRGTDTSEFLRNAYRAALTTTNGNADKWAMKEAAIARKLDINKSTLKGMRDREELFDEHGPIWRKLTESSVTVFYDVLRTRKFFGIVEPPQTDPPQAEQQQQQ